MAVNKVRMQWLRSGWYLPSPFCFSEPGEPVHILSIAVRGTEDMDDNQMAQCFGSFCKLNREEFAKHRVRRITFAALKK